MIQAAFSLSDMRRLFFFFMFITSLLDALSQIFQKRSKKVRFFRVSPYRNL